MHLPLTLDITGASLLVVGGGRGALQKVRALAALAQDQAGGPAHTDLPSSVGSTGLAMSDECDGTTGTTRMVEGGGNARLRASPGPGGGAQTTIRVVASAIHPGLRELARSLAATPRTGLRVDLVERPWAEADLDPGHDLPRPLLVYAFTDNNQVNTQVAEAARARGILVNAAGPQNRPAYPSPRFTSPASRVLPQGDQDFLVSVASLAGPGRTRGRNPRAGLVVLERIAGLWAGVPIQGGPEPADGPDTDAASPVSAELAIGTGPGTGELVRGRVPDAPVPGHGRPTDRPWLEPVRGTGVHATTGARDTTPSAPALNPPADAPPYLPMMMGLGHVLVFGGERGEGLQKTEKLALYAKKVTVVPETTPADWPRTAPEAPLVTPAPGGTIRGAGPSLVFGPGPVRWVKEALGFQEARRAAVHPGTAGDLIAPCLAWARQGDLLQGVDYVCSDLEDPELNLVLHQVCTARNIRHTVIDTPALSDTWFMGLVDAGNLLVAVSSRASCTFYAQKVREELQGDIHRRGPVAGLLAQIRASLPRRGRRAVLEAIWADQDFQAAVGRNDHHSATDRAWALADEHPHTTAPQEAHHE